MKTIIPLLCTFFLVGCNNTEPTEKAPSVQITNVITEDVNVTSASEPQAVVPQPTEVITAPTKVDSTDTEPKPVTKVKTEPKKAAAPKAVKEEVKPKVEVQAKHAQIDASALYGEKCASCHGAKADKPALGKSQIIAQWPASQIEEALHGYKSGSYGKEMKAIMQGQAKSLSPDQIKALSKYIPTL